MKIFNDSGISISIPVLEYLRDQGYDLIVFRCLKCAKNLLDYNPYVYSDGTTIPLNKIRIIIVDDHNEKCENSEKNIHSHPQKFSPIMIKNILKNKGDIKL